MNYITAEIIADEPQEQTKYFAAVCEYCDKAGVRKVLNVNKDFSRTTRCQYKCIDTGCISIGLVKPTHDRKGGGERPPKGDKWINSIYHTTIINKWGVKNVFPRNSTGFEDKKTALEMVEIYNTNYSTSEEGEQE